MKNCHILLCLLAAALLAVTTTGAAAQPAAGVYMIANSNGYNATDKTNVFYLTPAEECYYNGRTASPFFDTVDNGKPHLTTYKSVKHDDLLDALWEVQVVTDGSDTYYRLYHAASRKYLTANEMKTVSGYPGRLFVHLEETTEPGANTLFKIIDKGGGKFFITPKDIASNYSMNPNSGNKDQKTPTSDKGGVGGTIGRGDDANSNWYFDLPPAVTAPTITLDSSNRIVMETVFPGASIYYTTDGSVPTASSTLYTGPFVLPPDVTVIRAIAIRSGYIDSQITTFTHVVTLTVSSTDEMTNMGGSYILAEGFVANGTVGTQEAPFYGTIDGNFNTIDLSAPLIGYANGATIKNVIVGNATISGSGNTGAICCNALGYTSIYNCGVQGGSIGGTAYTGGLVGLLDGYSRVVNCFNFADITSGTEVGGIVGHNAFASTVTALHTMVMNCMFYGDITGGSSKAPIYNGELITNVGNAGGINNYNYFRYEAPYSINGNIDVYNGALGAEERFLLRFERYRYLLNSNRALAALYATGDASNAAAMAKWVLDTATAPYPMLKAQGIYPSVVNYDAASLPSRGTLAVTISQGSGAPAGATITTASLSLTITDQNPDGYNYNYHKVQLPYYNAVGTGNYTSNKVVTGWKITTIVGGTQGSFTTGTDAPAYNFVDRKCTDKDLYSVSGRVFAQGAYFDVPDSVQSIVIEPYWAKCVYLGDPTWDVTYTEYNTSWGNREVTELGQRYVNGRTYNINGSMQAVYTTFPNAMAALAASSSQTVYDNAIVLVGNFHRYCGSNSPTKGYDNSPFTLMSADLDFDNEPDCSMLFQHAERQTISPVRFDFLNFIGIGPAQKIAGSIRMPDVGIFHPLGWFEITNTCLIYFGQFEYEDGSRKAAPIILEGGAYDQFVSTKNAVSRNTQYIRLGSNAWFKQFDNGRHANTNYKAFTPHIPISVSGGEYAEFYLSGMFQPGADIEADNAECYISGGRFGQVAGAGMEQVNGDVTWIIDHADIDNFYGGGINAAKPVTGSINVTISDSSVDTFCGGPKFGDMTQGETVTTTATDCVFNRFFGAGYGGTSFNRVNYRDLTNATDYPYNEWVTDHYKRQYNGANGGVATSYEYEQLTFTGFYNDNTVGRFYVNYASLSLAKTYDVTSSLTRCNIAGNFYGGGNLGKVAGDVTSTLTDCAVAGSVFGAGFSATVPTVDVYPIQGMNPEPHYDGQAGVYVRGGMPTPVTYTWHHVGSVSAGNEFDEANHYIYTTEDLSSLGQVEGSATVTIAGTTTVAGLINGQATGGVFGGGDASGVVGDTNVSIAAAATGSSVLNVYGGGNVADVTGNVTVAMTGGNVTGDVYGGGAFANTNVTAGNTTTVNMLGGKVYGNVYGGGLGRKASEGVAAVVATVGGDVNVTLNGAAIGGSVFGCNNQNGTPRGDVLVTVLRTVNFADPTAEKPAKLADGDDEDEHPYELAAVYGGGNEAAYDPADDNVNRCKVLIDGCGEASIAYAYGGGNAAPVNQCMVEVLGTYELGYAFGGGNGANLSKPGADVGILDAEAYADDHTTGTYGPGNTWAVIHGGTVHHVFGGSNTRGNIIGTATVTLGDEDTEYCVLDVGEVFSCGNMATMDGSATINVACVDSKLKCLYGGAKQADVMGDVVLNINSGRIGQVFGGNKTSGVIHGTVTVIVEEKGCKPIIIDELYGGGDQAAYTSTLDSGDGPFVYIRSCTSIGTVYGGGYGETAVVTGNPVVDINMDAGYTTTDPNDAPENRTARPLGEVNTVFGGGNAAVVDGSPIVRVGSAGKSANITGNVFGGGNNADVTGHTTVQIGQ